MLGQPLPLHGHLPVRILIVVFDDLRQDVHEEAHGRLVYHVVEGNVAYLWARRLTVEDLHHQL